MTELPHTASSLHRLIMGGGLVMRGLVVLLVILLLGVAPWLVFVMRYSNPTLPTGDNRTLAVETAPITESERVLANQILVPNLLFERDIPVWRPPPEGAFGVRLTDPDRPQVDRAVDAVLNVRSRVLAGESDQGALNEVFGRANRELDRARSQLVEGSRLQDERGVILYHRAVLATWRGDRNVQNLEALATAIGRLRASSPEARARVAGVTTARLYLEGRAELVNTAVGDPREAFAAAAAKFEQAEAAAQRARGGFGVERNVTFDGDFVVFRADAHVVDFNAAQIANDRMVALARAGNLGAAATLAEPLIRQPGVLRNHRVLASNALAIHLVGQEHVDLEAIQTLVNALSLPYIDETLGGLDHQADLRLAALRVIVGLPVAGDEASQTSAVRAAYERIQAGDTAIRFPRIVFGADPATGDRLDEWLFFRRWRGLISRGNIGGFLTEYRALSARGGISMGDFDDWREGALTPVRQRLEDVAYGRAGIVTDVDRDAALLLLSQPEFDARTRFAATAEGLLPGPAKWMVLLIQIVVLFVLLAVFWLLPFYRGVFRSHHGAVRLSRAPPGPKGDAASNENVRLSVRPLRRDDGSSSAESV